MEHYDGDIHCASVVLCGSDEPVKVFSNGLGDPDRVRSGWGK